MKNIITYLSALITFIGFLVVLIGCENVLNVNKVTTIGVVTMCFGAVIFLLNSKNSEQ
jgi:hypothetical protein